MLSIEWWRRTNIQTSRSITVVRFHFAQLNLYSFFWCNICLCFKNVNQLKCSCRIMRKLISLDLFIFVALRYVKILWFFLRIFSVSECVEMVSTIDYWSREGFKSFHSNGWNINWNTVTFHWSPLVVILWAYLTSVLWVR